MNQMPNVDKLVRHPVSCIDCHDPQTMQLRITRPAFIELKARVETIQDRVFGLRNRAMDALAALIGDLKEARARGVTDAQLELPRTLQRRAQFMLDFVEAENSTGFHAPEEAERVLAESIDYARQGQLALRGASVPGAKPAASAGHRP